MSKNATIFFLLIFILTGAKVSISEEVTEQTRDEAVNAELLNTEIAPESAAAAEPVAEAAPQEAQLKINEPAATTSLGETTASAATMVKSIDIQGNKSIGIAQILAKIKTRVGQDYVEAVVSDDLKRLYNTGFFADVLIDHEAVEGGYKVIVKVKEKPIVDEVTFSKIRFYNKKFLESKMKTKKDKFLDNKALKDDQNTIEELYKKKGLSQIKVDVETFVDEATNKASLHFIINEGYRVRVKRINVYGNTAYTDGRLIKVMKSRWAWIFNRGYLKDDVVEEDMTRIQTFYAQNGYIDAKATYQVEQLYKGFVNINITVEEGKRYYVGEVTFKGNAILSEYDVKASLKNMREGNVFSRDKLDQDLGLIRDAYFDKGYISASVVEATSFNNETGKVDINLDITEGALAFVNKIKIQGNTRTRDIVVRRELRMYPGDQFDGKKLRRSKERLKNLGYFEDIGYDIEDTDQNDQKDLVVQVKEAKTGTFSFGGGYSTVDQLVGFIEVEQKNFDISNWPSFTGGGQNLKVRGEIGSTRKNALLSFTEPWLFDYPISGGFDLYLSERKRDNNTGYAYDESRVGGNLRLGKSFNDNFSVGSIYRLEQTKISNFQTNVSQDLLDEEGRNLVSSIGFSTAHDYRDSPIVPTKGWIVNNSLDIAGGPFGADKDFWRAQTSGSYYVPLKFDEVVTVLQFSGRTGIVKAYDNTPRVPIFERFFTGGANSIRGYNERRVGPLDPVSEDSIGGETILVGNIEYTVPIIDIIKGAVFYDVGNVWSKAKDYASGGLKSGTGVGLRVKTPIGPINLDYGIPLNDEPGEEERSGKFYFSVSRGF